MKAFKITLNGQDQNTRFATSEEAQMLADVLTDDFPEAEVQIVEIEQFTRGAGLGARVVESDH